MTGAENKTAGKTRLFRVLTVIGLAILWWIILLLIGKIKVLPCYFVDSGEWRSCMLHGLEVSKMTFYYFNNAALHKLYLAFYHIIAPLLLGFTSFTVYKKITGGE